MGGKCGVLDGQPAPTPPTLDFDSVQRGNPEIERRAQEVVNHCWSARPGQATPSSPSTTSAPAASPTPSPSSSTAPVSRRPLRPVARCLSRSRAWRRRRCGAMSPRSGTSLAIAPGVAGPVSSRTVRARAVPVYAVVGVARPTTRQLVLADEGAASPARRAGPPQASAVPSGGSEPHAVESVGAVVGKPPNVLLGTPPTMQRDVKRQARRRASTPMALDLRRPAKGRDRGAASPDRRERSASSMTIADRTVGGLTHRDQMVGPWQVPVADVRRHPRRFPRRLLRWRGDEPCGERMPLAGGGRTPPPGRMAVGRGA